MTIINTNSDNTKLNFSLTLVAKAACVISLSLTMENS
jgi:hypothetical protein